MVSDMKKPSETIRFRTRYILRQLQSAVTERVSEDDTSLLASYGISSYLTLPSSLFIGPVISAHGDIHWWVFLISLFELNRASLNRRKGRKAQLLHPLGPHNRIHPHWHFRHFFREAAGDRGQVKILPAVIVANCKIGNEMKLPCAVIGGWQVRWYLPEPGL